MEHKIVLSLVCLVALISGCAGQGALPSALSGELYTYDVPVPTDGTAPFSCSMTAGAVLPAGLTFQGCTLSGTAPTLVGVTEKMFSFQFTITDASGRTYGPIDATLPVRVAPLEFSPSPLPAAARGQLYTFNFCDTPSALECPQSASISGGAGPPYTFSATGLPLGLFLTPDGALSGTIPEEAPEGPIEFAVCAIDSSRTEDCADVTLDVTTRRTLQYTLRLKATHTYNAESVNHNRCGGSAYETGVMTWEIDDVPITLTDPYNTGVGFTSDEYDLQTDEYGYRTPTNFRFIRVPMKVTGQAATSYDACEFSTCRPDSSSRAFDLTMPVLVRTEGSKLAFYLKNFGDINPSLARADVAQLRCESGGGAEYMLKTMALGLQLRRTYYAFDIEGGTDSGEDDDPGVYTYLFSAAPGHITERFTWSITLERTT